MGSVKAVSYYIDGAKNLRESVSSQVNEAGYSNFQANKFVAFIA